MAQVNGKVPPVRARTHEGGRAATLPVEAQLRRSVLACLLWEDNFYEDGETVATRIKRLVPQVEPRTVAALAVEARTQMNLRHAPLLLLRELARHPRLPARLVSSTLAQVIQRADELAEFLALYWAEGKQPLSKQVKRGLAWALRRFNEYELAKYNRDKDVKLRDVMFLTHPKPKDEAQAALWKKLADDALATPDTWEVALSAGGDKQAVFTRLLQEQKLGYLALLRNLRNMVEAGVDPVLVRGALLARRGADRVLPFRYIAAARHAPQYEQTLDAALLMSLEKAPKLTGDTVVLVDVSGSMDDKLSGKSDMTRLDAACGLAMVLREVVDGDVRVFSFSQALAEVPARRGMALRDAIVSSQPHGGTFLAEALKHLKKVAPTSRLVVITDEQAHDDVGGPYVTPAYLLNVASNQHGVGYGPWTRFDGFSEGVVRYLLVHELDGVAS